MLNNQLTASETQDFYRKKYRKIASPNLGHQTNPKELFGMAVTFQDDRVRLLKKYFGRNKRLLEIGCSAGMFLWHAKNYFKEVVGIDYDSHSAKFASRKCGCKVYTVDIEQTDLEENSFDVICAFQTLEHVKNPIDFISRHKKYLKPGGIMAIEVPNLRDALVYAYDLPNHKKFFFHISHLWYFTEKSLTKLMKLCNLDGKIFYIQDYNILNHMNWILNDRPQTSSLSGLSAPLLPLRERIEPRIKVGLAGFIQKMDELYKNRLSELKITSNIFYIGKMQS